MNGPSYERTATRAAKWQHLPRALDSLWQDCLCSEGGADVSRALTANFVGVAAAEHAAALSDAVETLQRRSPCRAFLLLLDPDASARAAELSATTRCHGSLRDIVLERVELRLRPDELLRAPGLLRPLILDDLPSHLCWAMPWPADPGPLDALTELCRHTIVDSRRFGNPARELLVLEQRREAGRRVTDLSWLRLQPWRRALAEAFERFPWRAGTTVSGTMRHGRAARAATMLLGDWLHARLGAAMALEPDGRPESPGPDHVALQVGDVTVESELVDGRIVTHVTTEAHCYLPFAVSAPDASDPELIATAIDRA